MRLDALKLRDAIRTEGARTPQGWWRQSVYDELDSLDWRGPTCLVCGDAAWLKGAGGMWYPCPKCNPGGEE